jgi:Peptidase C39 family
MPSSALDGIQAPKQSHEDVRLMNPLFIPTLLGALAFFGLGMWTSRRVKSRAQKLSLVFIGLAGAVPALLFVIGYTGILGEVKWFYSFRSWPGTELTASGAGLIAGWLQAQRNQSQRVRKQMSAGFIPFILLLCVTIPYLKQIFLRPNWNNFTDRWSDGVCFQSSESSCGPASAATLLRLAGKPANEREIAVESFTSRRGTENWYLIRTLRRHGLNANYAIGQSGWNNLPFPAIVGVRLGSKSGAGHFIAVLGKAGNKYVIGDPLSGRAELDESQFQDRYYFTGFSIVVRSDNH